MKADQFKASLAASSLGIFRTWLHAGKLAAHLPEPTPPVYKTLGQFVSEHAVQRPGWEKTLVRDFLAATSPDGTVRDSLRACLTQSVPWLVNTAFELADPATVADGVAMQAICDEFLAGAGATQLVDTLLTTVDAEMADLTLMDTFLRRREAVGFASWSQYNSEKLEGAQEVPPLEIDSAGKTKLFLDVCVDDDLEPPMEAGEWVGGTKDTEQGQWRSVAAGMVYHFLPGARKRTKNLLEAADNVSGGDYERVAAFLESNGNCETILKKGDIAFVWEWERRHDAQPGEGVTCLAAICTQLRATFPTLASIVFSLSPQRFSPRAAGEPPLVTEARLADLDKLHAYVAGLHERLGLDVYIAGSDSHDVSRPEVASM